MTLKQKLNETKKFYGHYLNKEDLEKSLNEIAAIAKEKINTKEYNRYYAAVFYKSCFGLSKAALKFQKYDAEDVVSYITESVSEAIAIYNPEKGSFITIAFWILKRKLIPNYYKTFRVVSSVDYRNFYKLSINDKSKDILISIETSKDITSKEKLILYYIIAGYSTMEIVRKLGVCFDTYKRWLFNLQPKMKLILDL